MRWDERQRAMLAAMGLRLWSAAATPSPAELTGDGDDEGLEPGSTRTEASGAFLEARPEHGPLTPPMAAGGRQSTVAEPQGFAVTTAGRALPDVTPEHMFSERRAGMLPGPDEVLDGVALAARAAVCTACALCAGRTRVAFGAIDGPADWLVVGDAPDAEDDSAGEPFAATAGRLLDNMLAAIDVSRSPGPRERRACVTHAVKCRPPAQRMPEPGELERCSAYLRRQIEIVQPHVILAMGRSAAQAVLGDNEPVARLRGRVHRRGAVAVVVTASAGHLLRHPESKADAWDDLCLALEAAKAAQV